MRGGQGTATRPGPRRAMPTQECGPAEPAVRYFLSIIGAGAAHTAALVDKGGAAHVAAKRSRTRVIWWGA